jgi:hypothetical protein
MISRVRRECGLQVLNEDENDTGIQKILHENQRWKKFFL